MQYVLTEEGEKYLKEGLPEKNLVLYLEKVGRATISELEKEIENFDIALLWAKKNGWVELKFNELILVKKPESFPEEEALRKIKEGRIEEVDKEMLKILIQRKLVEKVSYAHLEELKGKEITVLSSELIKSGYWREVKIKKYGAEIPPSEIFPGKIHPYIKIIKEVKEFLVGLGFKEVKGPLVEINFWNCDALFMPSDHPAREIHDIFFIDGEGEVKEKEIWKNVKKMHEKRWGYWDEDLAKKLILRSQCTAVSARCLQKSESCQ